MNETQLVVINFGSNPIESISNNPLFVGIGAISRLIVISSPEVAALTTGDTLTIFNAAGQSVVKTLGSMPVIDSPVPGQTRLNFIGTWAQDYSAAAGGYFLLEGLKEFFLDLYENESISQNWAFSDLGSFAIQSPFTRQFMVPNTANNKNIFEAIANPNFSKIDNFFYYRLPARIRVDSIPIVNGYVKLNKVITQRDLITDYEITFYGNTSDFARDVNQRKLSNLALSDINPFVTFANVNSATSGTLDYLFAFCDRGQNWNNAGGRSLGAPIYAGDFTPCLRWDVLFDRIITGAGWTYEADDVINTIDSYWMPFLNSKNVRYTANLSAQFFFSAYLSSDITLTPNSFSFLQPTTETADPASRYTAGATSIYSAPLSGEFSFTFWVTYTIIGNATVNSQAIGTLQIYADNITSGVNVLITEVPINPNSGADLTLSVTGNALGVITETNDQIKLRLRYVQQTGLIANNVRIESGPANLTGTGWKLNEITTAFDGFELDFAANAPDMRQIDFITDVVKMLNLAVIEHPTIEKRLIFKTLSEYIGSGPSYDWTQKLDLNKDVTIYSTVEQQKAELYFTYTTGADGASKLFQQAGRTYGDLKIDGYTVNPSIEASEFITGKQDIKLVTQSTPALNVASTHIPKFIDANGSFVTPGPRCLYYSHTINLPQVFNAGNYIPFNAPTLSHYSVEEPTIADFDLNWAPEVPLHNIEANPYFTLFNLYWRDYLNEIYSPDARIMEAYFMLEVSDITPVDFSALIFIKDGYWRILEISDYKYGSRETTKVKLLKVVTPLLDCDVFPSAMDADGVVTFKDINGDPAAASAVCCVRYGYEWDPVNELCYGLVSPDSLLAEITQTTTYNTIVDRVAVQTRSTVQGTNINNNDSNTNVVISGNEITAAAGNPNTLAVGDSLTLATIDKRGAAMLGKSVYTTEPGLHLGGGFVSDNRLNTIGANQWGVVMLSAKDALTVAGDRLYLYTEGIPNEWLSIPDDTSWNVLGNLNVFNPSTNEHYSAVFNVYIDKLTGVTSASAITILNSINTFASLTFTININTAVAGEHRFNLISGGGGFPYTSIQASCSLNYQQFRK